MVVVGALPAQYLGRGPGPLYIEIATTVEGIESLPSRTPHQLKNTPREAVLPLYCSSSTPKAIHHTTHWIRVLHHNGGPNQYKPSVPCVVHHASLDPRRGFGAWIRREKNFVRTLEFEP